MNSLTGTQSAVPDWAEKPIGSLCSFAIAKPASFAITVVPVPDGGTTLILLGFGFTVLAVANRYFRRRAKLRAALKRP